MRRLLRALARGEEITQDISTLENPAIIAQLRGEPAQSAPGPGKAEKRARRRQAQDGTRAPRKS